MSNWVSERFCDVCEQIPVNKKYRKELVQNHGKIKVLDQSQFDIFGWHNNSADINASPKSPVFTFANHTCFMRWMEEPFSLIQNVFPLRGIPGKTDTRFLYYASGALVVQEGYKGHFPKLKESIIKIPPIPEQKKIAEILYGIDNLVSLHKKKIISLQNLLNAHLSDDHFDKGELIDMSNACSVVADCLHKTPVFTSRGFPIVRTPNVRDGELTYEDMKYVTSNAYEEWTSREKPTYGDILFTREAPLGEACIVPKKTDLCIGQRMMLLRPNPAIITPEFLLYKIRSRAVQDVLLKITGGSTVGHVNVRDVRSLQIRVPDLKLQLKATTRYKSIKRVMDGESNLIFKLVQVKNALSSELLSGRKRVQL